MPGRVRGATAGAGEGSAKGDDIGSARVGKRNSMPQGGRQGEMWDQLLFSFPFVSTFSLESVDEC